MVAANLLTDSHPKSVGLVWGLAATRRSVCIHQMNRVNSRNDYVSTINIVVVIIIIIITTAGDWCSAAAGPEHCAVQWQVVPAVCCWHLCENETAAAKLFAV